VILLLLLWACGLIGGLLFPMVTRTLYGTIVQLAEIPNLLGDAQINDDYSLLNTMRDVGLGGGGNAFLQKDLAAFTMLFPLLMVVVASLVLLVPMKPKVQSVFAEAVKFCFSFSGWEILILVTLVMTSELQALTVTIPAGVDGGVSKHEREREEREREREEREREEERERGEKRREQKKECAPIGQVLSVCARDLLFLGQCVPDEPIISRHGLVVADWNHRVLHWFPGRHQRHSLWLYGPSERPVPLQTQSLCNKQPTY